MSPKLSISPRTKCVSIQTTSEGGCRHGCSNKHKCEYRWISKSTCSVRACGFNTCLRKWWHHPRQTKSVRTLRCQVYIKSTDSTTGSRHNLDLSTSLPVSWTVYSDEALRLYHSSSFFFFSQFHCELCSESWMTDVCLIRGNLSSRARSHWSWLDEEYVLSPTYSLALFNCLCVNFISLFQQHSFSSLSSHQKHFISFIHILFICFACCPSLILLWHVRFPLTNRALTSKMKWTGIRKCMLHYLQCKRWPVLLKKKSIPPTNYWGHVLVMT